MAEDTIGYISNDHNPKNYVASETIFDFDPISFIARTEAFINAHMADVKLISYGVSMVSLAPGSISAVHTCYIQYACTESEYNAWKFSLTIKKG